MQRGGPKVRLVIAPSERQALEGWSQRRNKAQALALRARIILLCGSGMTNGAVAKEVRVSPQMVGKWRRRFVEQRLNGLYDEPRPGAPRRLGDDAVERVVVRTPETTPRNAPHWSVRSMPEAVGITSSAVHRIWRPLALRPHRTETFKLLHDRLFIERVRDIVGLYLNPPDKALVLCVDEKTQIQALNSTQPLLPMRPRQPQRRTQDYQRRGTTSLFAALDYQAGRVIGEYHRRHRSLEFRSFLNSIDANVPRALDVHLIVVNYGTHKSALIGQWFAQHPRFHLYFIPTSASWINIVERWFAQLSTQRIRRATLLSTRQLETLETAIQHYLQTYLQTYNDRPTPFVWTKTADQIFASLDRFFSTNF